ncbi:unnamed protein product, partial [Polarella glacialis]
AATAAALSSGKPVVVIVESLETAPFAAVRIRRCLREVAVAEGAGSAVFVVATMSVDPERLQESELSSFGYVIRLGAPGQVERKQFLLRLLAQVSRLDAQWGSALRESAVETLANLTESYTFAEIDFVLRRAFLRSSSSEGGRDPVALHHFEKILADTPPQAVQIFDQVAAAGVTSGDVSFGDAAPAAGQDTLKKKAEEKEKKKPKGDSKDPMESIFG